MSDVDFDDVFGGDTSPVRNPADGLGKGGRRSRRPRRRSSTAEGDKPKLGIGWVRFAVAVGVLGAGTGVALTAGHLLGGDKATPERFEDHVFGARLPDGFEHARDCVEVYDLAFGANVVSALEKQSPGFAEQAQANANVMLEWVREDSFGYASLEPVVQVGADALAQMAFALRQEPVDESLLRAVRVTLEGARASFELGCPTVVEEPAVRDDGRAASEVDESGVLSPMTTSGGSLAPLPESEEQRLVQDAQRQTTGVAGEGKAADPRADRASEEAARRAAEAAKRERRQTSRPGGSAVQEEGANPA